MRLANLLRLALATSFAKTSLRPQRAALFRVCTACLMAVMVGNVVARLVRQTDLPADVPLRIVMTIIMLLGYIVSTLLLLPQGQRRALGPAGAAGVLWLLPLKRFERFAMAMIPGWVSVLVLVVFAFESFIALAHDTQHPVIALQASWLAGLLSGHGLSVFFRYRVVKSLLLFVSVIVLSLRLLQVVYSSDSMLVVGYVPYVALLLVLLPMYGYVRRCSGRTFSAPVTTTREYKPLVPYFLPFWWWMVVKLWRSSRVRASLGIAGGMLVALAVSMFLRRQIVDNPYPYLLITATLAATFCCELRGLMRRTIVPEAITLRGMRGVIFGEWLAGYIAAVMIGLPLFFALLTSPAADQHFFRAFMVYQALGAFAGMTAGSVFVPGHEELGNQFFAALSATGLVIGLPKVLSFRFEPGGLPIAASCLVLIGFGVGTLLIENIRRKRYGGT